MIKQPPRDVDAKPAIAGVEAVDVDRTARSGRELNLDRHRIADRPGGVGPQQSDGRRRRPIGRSRYVRRGLVTLFFLIRGQPPGHRLRSKRHRHEAEDNHQRS
ncbi:MAG: hypothetical protein ISP49_17120 [Reyranella sp.]|nr:hypothetical protein [Reyranella sp.]